MTRRTLRRCPNHASRRNAASTASSRVRPYPSTERPPLVPDDPHDVIGDLDILYMSRVQRERFVNEEEYIRLKDFFILDKQKMAKARVDMIVLHPLPRVNEIAVEVDSDPRAKYFKQAKYGMYVRMALICKLLGVK